MTSYNAIAKRASLFFDAILKEHFLLSLPNEVQAFLLSHQATCNTLDDLGKAADLWYQVKRFSNDRSDFRPNNTPVAATYRPQPQDANNSVGRGGGQASAATRAPVGKVNWRGGYSSGVPGQNRDNFRGRPGFNTLMQRGRGGSFLASKSVKSRARYDRDDFACDTLYDDKHDDAKQALVYADKEYVVPLYVNGFNTYGIRDSGCNFVGLVAKYFVKPESINYDKCISIKGAFDGDNSRKVPTAIVTIRSELCRLRREKKQICARYNLQRF